MHVVPAGSDRANSGHHHLLIDTEFPPRPTNLERLRSIALRRRRDRGNSNLETRDHTLQLLLRQGSHSAHAAGVFAAHQGPCRRRLDPDRCASGHPSLFRRPAERIHASSEDDHSLSSCQYGHGAGGNRKAQHRPTPSPDQHQAASAGSTDTDDFNHLQLETKVRSNS